MSCTRLSVFRLGMPMLALLFLQLLLVMSLPLVVFGAVPSFQNPLGAVSSSQPLCANHWQSIGPFHVANSYPGISAITDPEDIGAASEVYVVPGSDVAFVATVNGGVWKTSDVHSSATFGGPHWQPMTDNMPCLSIQAVTGSADDTNVVVAGCGYPSNSAARGGEARGALISLDSGSSWRMTSFPVGWWVSSVLVSGTGETSRVLVAARETVKVTSGQTGTVVDSYQVGSTNVIGGVWVSTNAGATFTSTLSGQSVRRIIRHPALSTTIFAAVIPASATDKPLYISTDEGSTWTATAGVPSWNATCPTSTAVKNIQLSMSSINGSLSIFLGYYLDPNCYTFFQSSDSGVTWNTIANVPSGGLTLGNQGKSNFALQAAPTSLSTVFVAGTGGLVFRVDASTSSWTLISSPAIDPSTDTPAYKTTKNTTAPHADARQFTWDYKTGDLILTNDGGAYRRTNPMLSPEQGDWTTLAGDLSTTEIYQMALDPTSGAIIVGAQDNSLMLSQFDGTEKSSGIWSFLLTGDGTTVGIDTSASPAVFYGGDQSIAGWFRVAVNANSAFVGVNSAVTTFGGTFGAATCSPGTSGCLSFLTTQAVNSVQPSRVLLCTQSTTNSVCYDSTFTNNVATALEFDSSAFPSLSGDAATTYVFGGNRGGVSNANVVLAVGRTFVWSRSVAVANAAAITTYSGGNCTGTCKNTNMLNRSPPWAVSVSNNIYVAQHPADYYINALFDDAGHIWITVDFGQNWVDLNMPVNSNLLAISGHTSIDTFNTGAVYFLPVQVNGVNPLIVGTTFGTFVSFNSPAAGTVYSFVKLGANQPRTIPTSYAYNAAKDTLTMSLFGRGCFVLQQATVVMAAAAAGDNSTTATNPSCTTPLYPNVPNAWGYSAGANPAPIGFGADNSTSSATSSSTAGSAGAIASSTGSNNTPSSTASAAASTATSPATASSTADSTSTTSPPASSDSSTAPTSAAGGASTAGSSDASNSTSSTGSSDSSSPSSTGSSTSNPDNASSSTGSSGDSIPDLSSYDIPTDLPLVEFSLHPQAIKGWKGLQAFKAEFLSRIAFHTRVARERIVLMKLDNAGSANSNVFVQFSVSAALTGDSVDAATAVRYFLSRAWQTPQSSKFYVDDSIFSYTVPGTVLLSADQTIATLPEIKFALSYDMASLPGGSQANFRALVLSDIAKACSVPESRVTLVSLDAGSVNAQVLISPKPTLVLVADPAGMSNSTDPESTEIPEPDSNVVANDFAAAATNTSSRLYGGQVTGATVGSSVVVGQRSRIIASTSSSNGGFIGSLTMTASIGVVVGIAVGACLVIALMLYLCLRTNKSNLRPVAPHAAAITSTTGKSVEVIEIMDTANQAPPVVVWNQGNQHQTSHTQLAGVTDISSK